MPFDAIQAHEASTNHLRSPRRATTQPAARRFHQPRGGLARLTALALAAILGLAASIAAEPSVGGDADLRRLMQGMAILKGIIASVLIAAMGWRLSMPASAARMSLYLVAAAAMMAGIGLMWRMTHLAEAALLLHVALLSTIFLLFRDQTLIHRIEEEIARRVLAHAAVTETSNNRQPEKHAPQRGNGAA